MKADIPIVAEFSASGLLCRPKPPVQIYSGFWKEILILAGGPIHRIAPVNITKAEK
jgi:hypothetical protein